MLVAPLRLAVRCVTDRLMRAAAADRPGRNAVPAACLPRRSQEASMVLQKKEPCSQRKAWACASKRRLDAVRVHLAAAVLSGPERVAELVITLMLAEGREERREALLKLERQLDRCSEADAEAAMEAGVVHVLTPIAVVTGDAEWDRAAAVAANILATLSLLTRDGSMGDSPRDASAAASG